MPCKRSRYLSDETTPLFGVVSLLLLLRLNLRGKSVEKKNNEYCPLALLYCSTVNL